MIYLASPYSHAEERIRTRRYLATREFVWHHLQLGVPLFSPIVYAHQFARDFSAPIDAVSWQFFNDDLLELCSAMWILRLEGWDKSAGVAAETAYAIRMGIPYSYMEPLPYATL